MLCLTALTLGATPAHAGSYSLAISGGQYTDGNGDTFDDTQNGSEGGADYLAAGDPGIYSADGTVTVTCTWQPDPGETMASDPPPQNVILDEQSDAYFEYDGDDTGDGSCSDGLGDPEIVGFANIFYGESQGEHYSLHTGGPSFTFTRSPFVDPGPDCDNNNYIFYTLSFPSPGSLGCLYVNKDLPTNFAWQTLPSPAVVYGGSVPSTSDSLWLLAGDGASTPGTTYTWSVQGVGGFSAPGTSTQPDWVVGPVPPTPGIATFQCIINHPDGTIEIKQFTIEIGIRTDDVVTVGWIDPSFVTVNSAGVSPQILSDMAPGLGSGPPGSDPQYPFNPIAATARITALADNDDHLDYNPTNAASILGGTDRNYILDWMFKYAANPDPVAALTGLHTPDVTDPSGVNNTTDFTCAAGYMDFPKYQAYIATGQNYKLVNHFQVKYRVNLANPSQFNGIPILLHSDALVGATVNPTGLPPELPPLGVTLLDTLFGLPVGTDYNLLLDPQHGPANGLIGENPGGTHISQINDGSPDLFGIRAFNTLEALDTGSSIFWNDIGSKITFNCGQTAPVPVNQPYPTYYGYQNGVRTLVRPQTASPTGNFTTNPYPFGTVPSYGLPPDLPGAQWVIPGYVALPTLPGGRNGIATLPADPSASVPAYTLP